MDTKIYCPERIYYRNFGKILKDPLKGKLKKYIPFILLMGMALVFSTQAYAVGIYASATGDQFDDTYSFLFEIEHDPSDDNVFNATLTNTSDSSLADALIDLVALNINATFGNDFSIDNTTPDWTFSSGHGGVQFDVVGANDRPGDRLPPNGVLTFDFIFDPGFLFPTDPYTLWTDASGGAGTGIGGGNDFGQIAVSFQQLGDDGEGSDLIAANWERDTDPIPEPSAVLLYLAGIISLGFFMKKRFVRRYERNVDN